LRLISASIIVFLDVPGWTTVKVLKEPIGATYVKNLNLHLEKNKDASFLVSMAYVEPSALTIQEHLKKNSQRPFVPTVNESVKPVRCDPINVLASTLATRTEYADAWELLRTRSELIVPFVYCCHCRADFEALADQVNESTKEQLRVLLDYIMESQGHFYQFADTSICQGRNRICASTSCLSLAMLSYAGSPKINIQAGFK